MAQPRTTPFIGQSMSEYFLYRDIRRTSPMTHAAPAVPAAPPATPAVEPPGFEAIETRADLARLPRLTGGRRPIA